MPFKSVFERNPLSILPKHHRLENMTVLTGVLIGMLGQLFRNISRLYMTFDEKGKVVKSVQPIKTPVRTVIFSSLWCLDTNNWDLLGKENYLAFDW
jgi:hypothetical protein